MATAESETLRVCTVELVKGIAGDPSAIARALYAKAFLPPVILEKMEMPTVTTQSKATELLRVVSGKVSNTPSKYHDFVAILKKHAWLSEVVQLLEATYLNDGVRVQRGMAENRVKKGSNTKLSIVTLESLTLKDGRKICIPSIIGAQYEIFGHLILEDTRGTITANMVHKHQRDGPAITREILVTWCQGTGKKPVDWDTLIEVLDDIELSTLADDIRNRK